MIKAAKDTEKNMQIIKNAIMHIKKNPILSLTKVVTQTKKFSKQNEKEIMSQLEKGLIQ